MMKSISFVVLVSTLVAIFLAPLAAGYVILAESLDRRFTCTVPGYTQCPQAGLPNNFCCPSDHTCLSLGASFTILCCPQGSDCSDQSPISCDIEQQNATAHPESLIKTTDLSSDMFTCDSGCCPFGFNCSTNGNCSMFAEQKQIIDAELATLTSTASSTSSTSSTSTTARSSTFSATLSTSPSTTASPAPAETTANEYHSISISTGELVGGIIAIIFVIGSVAGFLVWFMSKRRKLKSKPKLEAESIQSIQKSIPDISSLGSFRKAELDSSSSRMELGTTIERRELDGSSLGEELNSSMRKLERYAAHEISGENQIHEMDTGVPKERRSWL